MSINQSINQSTVGPHFLAPLLIEFSELTLQLPDENSSSEKDDEMMKRQIASRKANLMSYGPKQV
jgi:hypothetical protein